MFLKQVCIVNKSSYEKDQLKLYQSLLGVKGRGAKSALSPTFSCNYKNQYILFVGQILVKSTTNLTNIFFENVHKYCPFLF